jgi:hypothetical protein
MNKLTLSPSELLAIVNSECPYSRQYNAETDEEGDQHESCTHAAVTADGTIEYVCDVCAATRKPSGYVSASPLIRIFAEYNSMPTVPEDRTWNIATAEELNQIVANCDAFQPSGLGWNDDATKLDRDGAEWALQQIAAGSVALMMQDEDGYYFAILF